MGCRRHWIPYLISAAPERLCPRCDGVGRLAPGTHGPVRWKGRQDHHEHGRTEQQGWRRSLSAGRQPTTGHGAKHAIAKLTPALRGYEFLVIRSVALHLIGVKDQSGSGCGTIPVEPERILLPLNCQIQRGKSCTPVDSAHHTPIIRHNNAPIGLFRSCQSKSPWCIKRTWA